jgi:hypothetical protein
VKRSKKKTKSPGSLLVQKRWAKTSKAQRREVAMMMVRARKAKRLAKNKNGPGGPKERK